MSKIFRIATKSLASIAVFVILLLIFINLPFSRNFVTGRVNGLFQKLELPLNIQSINKVRLKKVEIEGFSIIDPRGDSIIYADYVETHIKLLALMKSKVILDKTEVSGVGVKLLMNYQTRNYTIGEAFKKGEKKRAPDPDKKGSKWEINLKKGEISSVHFFMEDTLSGIHIEQNVDELKIKRFRLGLLERELKAQSLEIHQAKGSVKISPRLAEKKVKKNKEGPPWNFGLKDLDLEYVDFDFEQVSDSLMLEVAIDKASLETRTMDIPGQIIDLDRLSIEGADGIILTSQKTASHNDSKAPSPNFPWNIKTGKLDLKNVDLSFAENLAMEDLEMKLRNFQISQEIVRLKLADLGFRLPNGFALEKMEADLKSDSESTNIEMELKTGLSQVNLEAEARLGFFDLLNDPTSLADAKLQINNALFSLSDISSFTSVLEELSIYGNMAASPTRLDLHMDIQDHRLKLSEFSLTQNQKFNLSLSGYADHPFEPSISSGQIALSLTDINTPWLKELLDVSEIDSLFSDTTKLSLHATISDTFSAPELEVQVASNMGQVDLSGHMNFKVLSYALNSHFKEIRLGRILGVDALGSFTGSAHVEGSGLDAETIDLNFASFIDSITYNDYTYVQTKAQGTLQPGDYKLYLEARDPSLNSTLELNLWQKDSVLSAHASGTLFAQLDHLNLFTDTLAVETSIDASLSNKAHAFETVISLQDTRLKSPADTAALNSMEVLFRTDTSETILRGEGDFFDLDIQVDKSMHELDGFASSYGNYLRTFVDSSHLSSEQRVAELPGITATSNISNHEALDILLQDTGVFVSDLNFSILNEPSNKKVRYNIEGSNIGYKVARLGDLNIDMVDSAGVLKLDAAADSSSLFSGPPSSFLLSAQFANWNSLAALTILNPLNDTIYDIELESRIDSNLMFLSIPSKQLVLNHESWELDSSAFLNINLDSYKVSPDFKMRTDSSLLQMTHMNLDEEVDLRLNANHVKLTSLLWDDLLTNKPDGYLNGTIDAAISDQKKRKLVVDLDIRDASYSDLVFDTLTLNGFLAVNDSGYYAAKLITQMDSATIEFEGENLLDENRNFRADYSHIPLQIIQPFTSTYLSEMNGYVSGNFQETNLSEGDKFTGKLAFRGTKLKVIPLNTVFTIPDQSIQFEDDKIVLNDFRVQDTLNKALLVDGFIDFKEQPVYADLNIASSKLQLMNTTEADNEKFFGNLFVDSKISFKGPVTRPDIDARILLSRGTELNISSSDDVDLSESSELVNFTSYTEAGEPVQMPTLVGPSKFHLSTIKTVVEIDPSTLVNFNLSKKIFNINLGIQGGGLLNYSMMNNNQVTLSGRYVISEGSAELNIVGWPNKYFVVSKGGYVNWDGQVEDPEVKFEAVSKVSSSYTNPVDGKIRNVDFNVVLLLSNYLSDLNILFTINTEDQYLMSIINTLSPEEQMRQAITILLFEIIDLPGISTSSDYMTQQVSQILASQLNQLTKAAIKGVDISFGIDSYTQSVQGGGESTSTSLSYEVKKSLLNDRAMIEVSGRLQNSNETPGATDQALNNLSFEYQLDSAQTKYLKVYNEQTYEDVFEGQVTKTGVGFTYRKPYRTFGDIWKRKKKRQKENE